MGLKAAACSVRRAMQLLVCGDEASPSVARPALLVVTRHVFATRQVNKIRAVIDVRSGTSRSVRAWTPEYVTATVNAVPITVHNRVLPYPMAMASASLRREKESML
jgi:hypothetical protein